MHLLFASWLNKLNKTKPFGEFKHENKLAKVVRVLTLFLVHLFGHTWPTSWWGMVGHDTLFRCCIAIPDIHSTPRQHFFSSMLITKGDDLPFVFLL